MTSYEPQVGDIVDIRGTVVTVYSDGGFDTEHNSVVHDQKVTLVERPEPKVTLELSKSAVAALWSRSLSHLPDADFDVIYEAVMELGL